MHNNKVDNEITTENKSETKNQLQGIPCDLYLMEKNCYNYSSNALLQLL